MKGNDMENFIYLIYRDFMAWSDIQDGTPIGVENLNYAITTTSTKIDDKNIKISSMQEGE